jgi:RNA polymerase sigma-70 factor (ECF subfamily)
LAEPLGDEAHEVASGSPTPEIEVLRKLDREQLWEAMGQLSLELREALVLREFEALSYREIAEMIEVPIGTVMSRLSRGRRQLEKILCKREGKGARK